MGYKHLTKEQRYTIDALLQTPMSLREIGEVIGVSTGSDFSKLTDEMLAEIEWKLNHRPRKSLGYRTPLEYLTGLSVVFSCDKEKKQQEPIDIFMMDGNWIVIESDSNSEESIFVNGDDGEFAVGGYANAASGSDASLISIWWECSRCLFSGDFHPEDNNKITFVGGNIYSPGNPRTIRTNEEYVISKLNQSELVLIHTSQTSKGRVIFKRK